MAADREDGASRPSEGVPDAPDGYRNLVQIGQGGFAVVYRGLDIRFDRAVALKILRSERLDQAQMRRFNAECLAAGRLSSHPNIVTVYEAGTTRGRRPWLAMEYCSGGSLAQKVAAQGPLPVAEVISIGARLCSALHAAHQAGILHRDVKPQNVLLTSYGEPALADFGIASVMNEDDAGSIASETGAYTVVHAAPEILDGKAGTAAADIYSLGSTLYTLLAGQAPFARQASTGLAPLVTAILRNDLPVIARPGVPPELERLLRRCMAARPQDRPASAAEVSASLAEVSSSLAELGRSDAHPGAVVPAAVVPPLDAHPPGPESATTAPDAPAVSPWRLLVMLCGALAALLVVFTAWGLTDPAAGRDQLSPFPAAARAIPADATYNPQNVVVAQGHNQGELIVSWSMPIRPAVVATVIYDDADGGYARAIVSYDSSPPGVPQATLHGLPRRQKVCLSAVHVISLEDTITNAVSHRVCAVPR